MKIKLNRNYTNFFHSRDSIKPVIEFSSFYILYSTDSNRFIEIFLLNVQLSFIRIAATSRQDLFSSLLEENNESIPRPIFLHRSLRFSFFHPLLLVPTLYSPDTRPRAWQRRFKRISTVLLPVLTLEYFLSLKKTKEGKRALCPQGNKDEETKSIERWDLLSK